MTHRKYYVFPPERFQKNSKSDYQQNSLTLNLQQFTYLYQYFYKLEKNNGFI